MARHGRRSAAALALAVAAGLLTAGSASADGGDSIAAAPTVQYGTQQFGNLANAYQFDDVCGPTYQEYWDLPVTAGDEVTIDWETAAETFAWMEVFPVETTDYNVGDTEPAAHFEVNDNHKAQSVFRASRSGAMPLRFEDPACLYEDPGPYNFTAYVRHSVVVALPSLTRLSASGTVNVGTHSPEGAPVATGLNIELQLRAPDSHWTVIGSTPATSGSTPVAYTVPGSARGERVRLRAVAGGPAYQTGVSATQRVDTAQHRHRHAKVSLHVRPHVVHRLHRVRLSGHVEHVRRGARVQIWQRQVGSRHWSREGHSRVDRRHRFHYREVVHSGDRYYRACVKRRCSKPRFVRVVR